MGAGKVRVWWSREGKGVGSREGKSMGSSEGKGMWEQGR